jgi:hypothetical protein
LQYVFYIKKKPLKMLMRGSWVARLACCLFVAGRDVSIPACPAHNGVTLSQLLRSVPDNFSVVAFFERFAQLATVRDTVDPLPPALIVCPFPLTKTID